MRDAKADSLLNQFLQGGATSMAKATEERPSSVAMAVSLGRSCKTDVTTGQTGRCTTGIATPELSCPTANVLNYLISHPESTSQQVAEAFNRPHSWFIAILASDSFQLALDPVRHLIQDTMITATLRERFQALTLHSLVVLGGKLDGKEVSESLVLKSAEIGVKALGLGLPKRGEGETEKPTPAVTVDALADRLVQALEKQRRNVRESALIQQSAQEQPSLVSEQ